MVSPTHKCVVGVKFREPQQPLRRRSVLGERLLQHPAR